jgi:hypothetical protein
MLNLRIIDSENPTLGHTRSAEHINEAKLHVVNAGPLPHSKRNQNFEDGGTKLEKQYCIDNRKEGCDIYWEECQPTMGKKKKSREQNRIANTKETNIPCASEGKNEEDIKRCKQSKKKKETKTETQTAVANSLAVRKAYDEKQRAEIKRRSARKSKATAETEEIKDQEKENFGDGYEDDFESDDEIKSSLSEAKQKNVRNATILSSSNTAQHGHMGKKSPAEKAHRQKVPPRPKELVSCKETSFTLPEIVSNSIETLKNQSRFAKSKTKHAQQTKDLSTYGLCLPPIEMNNFVITKNPMGANSSETNHTVEAQGVLAKNKSSEDLNNQLESQHQSAHSRTDCSRLTSSVRRKTSPRYDRDVLDNRAKAPPFDTRCDEAVKVRFPLI